MPTPLYGGDGKFTSGVFKLDAENCRGDKTGGEPVMASIDNGEGFGFGPDRTLPTPDLFPAIDGVDDAEEAAADTLMDGGLCSRIGGGVRGERGGGDGSGDLGRIGDLIRCTGECAYGECD